MKQYADVFGIGALICLMMVGAYLSIPLLTPTIIDSGDPSGWLAGTYEICNSNVRINFTRIAGSDTMFSVPTKGISMGSYDTNHRVIITNRGTIGIGDVIVFRQDCDFILHRALLKCNTTSWLTLGDNNTGFDGCIDEKDILAKVVP